MEQKLEQQDKKQRYRIFYIDNKEKKYDYNIVVMKYFYASNDTEAYKVLKQYRKIANKEHTYYYGDATGNFVDCDGKHYDSLHEMHQRTSKLTLRDNIGIYWYRFTTMISEIKFWFKNLFYFLKYHHSLDEMWSIDRHILDDLIFNCKRLKEEMHGIPNDFCELAAKQEKNSDKQYKLAEKLWKKEIDKLLHHIYLYLYYLDFGIIDEKDKNFIEIDKKYHKTIPYKIGRYEELDYVRLTKMTQKEWYAIWEWIKRYGQALWD